MKITINPDIYIQHRAGGPAGPKFYYFKKFLNLKPTIILFIVVISVRYLEQVQLCAFQCVFYHVLYGVITTWNPLLGMNSTSASTVSSTALVSTACQSVASSTASSSTARPSSSTQLVQQYV